MYTTHTHIDGYGWLTLASRHTEIGRHEAGRMDFRYKAEHPDFLNMVLSTFQDDGRVKVRSDVNDGWLVADTDLEGVKPKLVDSFMALVVHDVLEGVKSVVATHKAKAASHPSVDAGRAKNKQVVKRDKRHKAGT